MSKENQKTGPKIKVETFYDIGGHYPYIVKFSIDTKIRRNTFSTKFFAIFKARKMAKFLGVKPELSFKPVIGSDW